MDTGSYRLPEEVQCPVVGTLVSTRVSDIRLFEVDMRLYLQLLVWIRLSRERASHGEHGINTWHVTLA